MARICEKLIEEISSGPGSLTRELQSHILTCPSCQETVNTIKSLKKARKGFTAKEAASIAAITSAVKKAAVGTTAASAATKASSYSKPAFMAIALAALVATASLFLSSEKPIIPSVPTPTQALNSIAQDSDQEVYITTAEDATLSSATEINIDSGSKLATENKLVELSENSKINVKCPSVYNHSNENFTLIKGVIEIEAMDRTTPLEISTPLAEMVIMNGSAEIVATGTNLRIMVKAGEVKIRPAGSDKEIILKAGQEWNISPEKDTIDAVGTILVSPDKEDLNSN